MNFPAKVRIDGQYCGTIECKIWPILLSSTQRYDEYKFHVTNFMKQSDMDSYDVQNLVNVIINTNNDAIRIQTDDRRIACIDITDKWSTQTKRLKIRNILTN